MLRRACIVTLLLVTTVSMPAAAQDATPAAAGSAAAPADSAPAVADSAAALARARQLSEWLWAVEVDSLWAHLSDGSRTSLGSPDNITEQVMAFVGRFGPEVGVVSESLVRQEENYRYARVIRLEAAEEPWTLALTLSPDLRIMDLDMNPGD